MRANRNPVPGQAGASRRAWPLLVVVLAAAGACRPKAQPAPAQARTVSGTVQWQLPNAVLSPAQGARVMLLGTSFLRLTDANGRFTLQEVPSGTQTVAVSAASLPNGPDDYFLRASVNVLAGDHPIDLGNLTLQQAGSISGTITIAGAAPAETIAIVAEGQPGLFAHTAADGTYQFPYLSPGQYSLVALLPGSADLPFATIGSVMVSPGTAATLNLATAPVTGPAGTDTITGRFIFDSSIASGTSYANVNASLIENLGISVIPEIYPVSMNADGTWSAAVPDGFYTLHLQDSVANNERYLGGIAVYPGATVPPIYLFDATNGTDTNGNGIPDSADPDADSDGVANAADGVTAAANPQQGDCWVQPLAHTDSDKDGVCDDIDVDADNDGFLNAVDNCPTVANFDQRDSDNDGVGDVCDNCPFTFNPNQRDSVGDDIGDACRGKDPCTLVTNGGCDPNATCTPSGSHPVCACKSGYTGDGITCEVNPCAINDGDCDSHATCQDEGGAAVCTCQSPYVGNGKTCEPGGGWQIMDPAPEPTVSPGVAVTGSQLVQFGGASGTDIPWTFDLAGMGGWTPISTVVDGPEAESAPAVLAGPSGTVLVVTAQPGAVGLQVWQLTLSPTPGWTEIAVDEVGASPPLPAVSDVKAVYDSVGNRVLVADLRNGGAAPVWELDLGGGGTPAWTMHTTTLGIGVSPAGLQCSAAAFNPAGQTMFVFGGGTGTSGACGDSNTLWELTTDRTGSPWTWSPANNTNLHNTPSARHNASLTYDGDNGTLVLFGGNSAGAQQSDTWTYASGAWQSLASAGGPAREEQGAAYYPATRSLYMAGGLNGSNPTAQVWNLSLASTSSWEQITTDVPNPAPRWEHSAALDSTGSRIILFGGNVPAPEGAGSTVTNDTWSMALPAGSAAASWTQLTPAGTPPAARNLHSAIMDPMNDQMIVFGGEQEDSSPGDPAVDLADLWALRFSSGTPVWQQIQPGTSSPPASAGHVALYDPSGQQLVVLGISGSDVNTAQSEQIWLLPLPDDQFTTAQWAVVTINNPQPLSGVSAVYDASPPNDAIPRVVAFFGSDQPPSVATIAVDFSPAGWLPLMAANDGPSQRTSARVAINQAERQLLVQGGVVNGAEVADLWSFDLDPDTQGQHSWHQLCPPGAAGGARPGSSLTATSLGAVWIGGALQGYPDDVLIGVPAACQ